MSTANAFHPVDEHATGRLVDAFLEAKLHAPPVRAEWVRRSRLLDQLDQSVSRPLTLIAAPAGYGKTTLAAQWTAASGGPNAAWVSLDAGDNDAGRLWTHIAAALQRAGCSIAQDLFTIMGANNNDVLAALLPTLVNALAAVPDEIVLVLDDFHFVTNVACHEQVAFLVEHLPSQAHLVILTRADPAMRLGRMRVTGNLSEIRADDLSFNASEVSSMLAHEQVHLTTDSVGDLMQRTEGWPAGLYLAALSLTGRKDPDGFVRAFSGDNRFIGDYLTEEVLSRHSERERTFVTTMSIFDRFSAPLGDYVAQTTGSAALLHDFERTNLFLVPLDHERRWFRFHHLFAAVARSELETQAPGRVAELHARAGEWFSDNGYIDEAVKHFLEAGKSEEAAHLVQANWFKYVDAGRAATVSGWLTALGAPTVVNDPTAGVTAAWMAALSGNREAFTRQLATLEPFGDYGPLPDGTQSVGSAIALLQGLFGFGGPVEMMDAGQRAVELETDGRSPFYAVAHVALGHAHYIAGDLDQAASHAFIAVHSDAAPSVIEALGSAVMSLVQAERGDLEASREYAERSMTVVSSNGLEALSQSSMTFTALGAAQAAAGKTADAMITLEHGLMLRRKNAALSPWPLIHHCLMMADVAIEAGQLQQARTLLDEAAQQMGAFDQGMGVMRARLGAAQSRLAQRRESHPGGEPLTNRELDIVRLLPGDLSTTEIARELYLSPNTVKTHTKAIYRKLGASSRVEAVRLAHERLLI